MECLEERIEDIVILGVQGRLDSTTSPAVEERLLTLIEQGERRLVVDCAQLVYISSAGLRVFLIAAKRMKQAQGRLVLAALRPEVREVFDLTGFSTILQIHPTRTDALNERGL
jgi:anti-anti-sigma factor